MALLLGIVLLTLSLPKPFTSRVYWNRFFTGSESQNDPPTASLFIHDNQEGLIEWALLLPPSSTTSGPFPAGLFMEPGSTAFADIDLDVTLNEYVGPAPPELTLGRPKIHTSLTGGRALYPLHWKERALKGMEISADFDASGRLQILRGPYIESWPSPPLNGTAQISEEKILGAAWAWLERNKITFDAVRGDTLWAGGAFWNISTEKWIGIRDVLIQISDPPADWLLGIDEETGDVIQAEDRLLFDTSYDHEGTGSVFAPNPIVMSGDDDIRWGDPVEEWVVTRRLTHLDGSGWLRGRYAAITTGLPPRTFRPNLQFIVESYHPGFEEVMAYFHITETADDLKTRGLLPGGDPFPVRVHASNLDNSWYRPSTGMIEFGDGGVPDAQDADIILHEFGHAVHDRLVPGFGEGQTIALSEGFSDYLACSYTGDPCLGEWDATYYSPPCLRKIDEFRIYPDDWTDRPHSDGLIWAGALWDIRQHLGEEAALDLALRAMARTSRWSSFVETAEILASLASNPPLSAPRSTPLIVRGILEERGLLIRRASVELAVADRLALPLLFPFPVGDKLSWGLEVLGDGKIILRDHPQSYESSSGDTTLEISTYVKPDHPPQRWEISYDIRPESVSIELKGLSDGLITQRSRAQLSQTGEILLSWGGEGQGLGAPGFVQIRSINAPPDTLDLMTELPMAVAGIYYQMRGPSSLGNGYLRLKPVPTPSSPPDSEPDSSGLWTAEWETHPEQPLPENRRFIFSKTPARAPLNVQYQLTQAGDFRLDLVDVGGRRVESLDLGHRSPGSYTWTLSSSDLSSGVYWIRMMNHSTTVASQKILILR
ncbi:MAG: M36 family metallopeptidase [Candidatus Eisenbacteria bacterium]|nr:M36 family metallopeptidase [Candidatus Eisenbacteria bacterium]